MGFFDKFRGEFIDIIEWLDSSQDTMVYRFERHNNEIKNGAKLVVRETQIAVFVDEGRIADVFQPGTHSLVTSNLPVLSTLRGWKYGFESPFKCEVYFVNTKIFTDNKWGTKNPIMMRDAEFGMVRLRAFGNYSMRIQDAPKFISEIVGTNGHFTVENIAEQLKNIIITRFTDTVGESKIPVLDLASNYDDLSKFMEQKICPEFEVYGLELTKLLVENISLPPEVEEVLDKRTSMGIVGDLSKYMQYQTANAMEKAAENPGNAGMVVGVGMMGQMMNQVNQTNQQQQNTNERSTTPPPLPTKKYHLGINGNTAGPYTMEEIALMVKTVSNFEITPQTLVWTQGMENWAAAETVPDFQAYFASLPPPLPPQ